MNAMPRLSDLRSFIFLLAVLLLAGCDDGSSTASTAPLKAEDINLIFVVTPDLAYHAPGDIDPQTANLTGQGLNRSLLAATYLKTDVLGSQNVTAIHVLAPMTHPQTAKRYPDMAAIGYIQQFALLNSYALPVDAAGGTYTANSFPLKVAYAPGTVPDGVAVPSPYCPDCTGLAFDDAGGSNAALAAGIIRARAPGYFVFAAPWETIHDLLTKVDAQQGYDLPVPSSYAGPDRVYAVAIAPSGAATLRTYDAPLNPRSDYPVLPAPVATRPCTYALQPFFATARTGGVDGAVTPANINTNERIYLVRHAEAHPDPAHHFEDGNYVGAGQWRALELPNALRGKINPDGVYSIDPAQWFTGAINTSYVRPSLTLLPYAVANGLPYELAANFSLMDPNEPQLASDFFFTGGRFSNRTVLVGWESSRIKPLINALLDSYGAANLPRLPTAWPSTDYDTLWTVTLDRLGNVTVDNVLCEGIDSSQLPANAPEF